MSKFITLISLSLLFSCSSTLYMSHFDDPNFLNADEFSSHDEIVSNYKSVEKDKNFISADSIYSDDTSQATINNYYFDNYYHSSRGLYRPYLYNRYFSSNPFYYDRWNTFYDPYSYNFGMSIGYGYGYYSPYYNYSYYNPFHYGYYAPFYSSYWNYNHSYHNPNIVISNSTGKRFYYGKRNSLSGTYNNSSVTKTSKYNSVNLKNKNFDTRTIIPAKTKNFDKREYKTEIKKSTNRKSNYYNKKTSNNKNSFRTKTNNSFNRSNTKSYNRNTIKRKP